MPVVPLPDLALLVFVALAAATDLAARKIPNPLILLGLLAALGFHLAPGGSALAWLGGTLTGLLVFLPLYLLRGMAAGDVKLMAMAGAFTGPALALQICAATCLIGGLMALAVVLRRRRWRAAVHNLRFLLMPLLLRALGTDVAPQPLPPGASVGAIPYGVAIALATALLLAWRHG
jgi:prepilin peptidase CpaA